MKMTILWCFIISVFEKNNEKMKNKNIENFGDFLEKFENLIKPLLDLVEKNVFEIFSLTKIRDALLPKLMSGEIRV